MPDPIKWKSKIVLVKAETPTYGVDSTPTGAANAVLLTDVELQPMEGEDVSRNLELPYLGSQEEIPTALRSTLTGSFELVGSGTAGTAPIWSPLIRAMGVAEVLTANTKVEYSPVSDGHESFTIYFWIGPTRHVFVGSRGTGTMTMTAQGIPVIRGTWTGLFSVPADTARPGAVDLSAAQAPQVASMANTPVFTIGAQPFVLRSFEFNLGNDVQPRLLVGAERIVIVDKAETMTATVEALPLATYNPFSVSTTATRKAIVLQHGTVAGGRVRIEAGQAQQKRLTGYSNAQNVLEWPLGFTPLPTSAGNDQWKITLT